MASIEVILQKDYPQLGFIGERVAVRKGYARNYLVPRGIAVEASSRNARELAHWLTAINNLKAKKKAEAEALAKQISEQKLEFKLKFGSGGKSFGSIGSRDIEDALKKLGFAIERRQISLSEGLRSPGTYRVTIKLHSEVKLSLPVEILADRVKGKKRAEEEEETGAEAEGEALEAAESTDSEEQIEGEE